MFMKQLKNILDNLFDLEKPFSFYILTAFLFLIHFSIFACYIIFCYLILGLILYSIKNRKIPPLPPYFIYFMFFVFFTLVSTFFAIDKLNSLKDNKDIFIFLLIPIFMVVINSSKKMIISLSTILLSAALSSLAGIFDIIKRGISLDHRLKGFTSHWMTYSGLLMFVFIFFFIFVFYEKKRNHKLAILASLIVLLGAILFSQTRSVWVGIVFALLLFLFFFKPKTLFYLIPAAFILVYFAPESVKHRMMSIFDLKNHSNQDRIHMMTTGFKIFKAYPLTGVGSNNIERVYSRYQHPDATQANTHLHNNFLQILAERGIFALISLVAAFISVLVSLIIRIRRTQDLEKWIGIGALCVFFGFLTAGMFEYNFGDSEIKFLLFYFISIPFISNINKKAKTS
jgi:O-antigen ligase